MKNIGNIKRLHLVVQNSFVVYLRVLVLGSIIIKPNLGLNQTAQENDVR